MLQAGAMLFTARRAAGHAISRMPLDPTWDDEGLRIELVR
jgi:predicted RNase H-like nuclease